MKDYQHQPFYQQRFHRSAIADIFESPMTNLTPKQTEFLQLISSHVPLQESRKSLKGNCPFHSDTTQSFLVNPEKQIFKCFGCGIEGDGGAFSAALAKMEKS